MSEYKYVFYLSDENKAFYNSINSGFITREELYYLVLTEQYDKIIQRRAGSTHCNPNNLSIEFEDNDDYDDDVAYDFEQVFEMNLPLNSIISFYYFWLNDYPFLDEQDIAKVRRIIKKYHGIDV
uniref:Uncharacterized protein n=1 Tax=viral metagenome TaxID=1070528 RepID=A0A6C0BF21_9ZZZZ